MTPEQSALLDKARENITGAKLLAENKLYDLAISRAYYAMFYLAEALLLIDGLAFSKHAGVIAKFGEVFAKSGRVDVKFQRYLIDSQTDRHTADYQATTNFTSEQVAARIANAEEFLLVAEALLNPKTE